MCAIKEFLRENVTLDIVLFWLCYSQIYTFSSLFWKPRVFVQCSWQILIIEVSTQWGIIWSILSETTAIHETWNIMIKLTNLLSCIMHTFHQIKAHSCGHKSLSRIRVLAPRAGAVWQNPCMGAVQKTFKILSLKG